MGSKRKTPRILLEGRPGSGKTTIARALVRELNRRAVPVAGFTTEEIRDRGTRVGFRIESVSGDVATLAHVDLDGPRVGKYGVDVAAFEDIALPSLKDPGLGAAVVIDELGKMELLSEPFRDATRGLFASTASHPVVATIHTFKHPFTDGLKSDSATELIRVKAEKRDRLPRTIATELSSWLGAHT